MTDCVTFWMGDRLGAVERACIRSVLSHGHSLALYCYRPPVGVPKGVELKDASAVLAETAIPESWRARADLYSDWFRYELLRRSSGTWLDTDIYLIDRLDGVRPYLFGWQDSRTLNNAVLRLPPDSPLLSALIEPFEARTTPRWLPWRSYLPMRTRELLTGQVDLTRVPWGTTSPHALTALAARFGLEHWAEPPERFYPVSWRAARWILDPRLGVEDVISRGTVAIHLWNERIKQFKDAAAPAGSFLHRLQQEGEAD